MARRKDRLQRCGDVSKALSAPQQRTHIYVHRAIGKIVRNLEPETLWKKYQLEGSLKRRILALVKKH